MITVFTTGGTFDKVYFDAKSEFDIGDTQVTPILAQAGVSIDYHVVSLLRKDSLALSDEDRQMVGRQVEDCQSQHIIITHGTDTMPLTAAALSHYNVKGKTIVFVGAMQPARMRETDAPFNLGFALAAVQLLSPDIYIAMNGQIFHHSNVIKNRAESRFERQSET